jgi:hypothetical protein
MYLDIERQTDGATIRVTFANGRSALVHLLDVSTHDRVFLPPQTFPPVIMVSGVDSDAAVLYARVEFGEK